MFYGAGAGGVETASAVLGDLVSAARRHVAGGPGVGESTHAEPPVLPISSVTTRYQITLAVDDQPGVLATVAGVFAEHGVSVETVSRPCAAGRRVADRYPCHRHPRGVRAALAATVERSPRSGVVEPSSPSCELKGCSTMAHQWRGVLREYADRLDVTDATPIITLGEGGTPLIARAGAVAPHRRRRSGSSSRA